MELYLLELVYASRIPYWVGIYVSEEEAEIATGELLRDEKFRLVMGEISREDFRLKKTKVGQFSQFVEDIRGLTP